MKMKIEDLKYLRGLIPGWSLYNKWVRGEDYSGENKYYPEIFEPLRIIGSILPFLGMPLEVAVYGSSMAYLIYSMLVV
jgi:hypothetical protein